MFIVGLVLLLVSNFFPPIYILYVHRRIFSEKLKPIDDTASVETKKTTELNYDTIIRIENSFFMIDYE